MEVIKTTYGRKTKEIDYCYRLPLGQSHNHTTD